jgi:Diacylglycerol kinase catalytic domain
MKRTLLITNAASGSANVVEEDVLLKGLRSSDLDVVRRISLPEQQLPDLRSVEADDFAVIVVLSGDGTVSSLCANLAGWQGAILVLPGGTMNLLSRRLHGDVALPELIEKLPGLSGNAGQIPIVRLGDREIMTGLTVGPSTRWGEVREGIRQGDVAALTEIVPAAWTETLADDGVWVDGHEKQAYAGVFVEPETADTLSVISGIWLVMDWHGFDETSVKVRVMSLA